VSRRRLALLVTCTALSAACGGSGELTVARPGRLQTLEDQAVSGRLVAEDALGRPIAFVVVSPPSSGSLEVDPASGAFTYRPALDFNGLDRFQFAASAGGATSAPAQVEIAVGSVNDAPVFSNFDVHGAQAAVPIAVGAGSVAVQVPEDGAVTGQAVAVDPDGQPVSYLLDQAPGHGIAELDANTGVFTYRPAPDYFGPDQLRIVATDGIALSEPMVVAIEVLPVNDPPVAIGQALALDEDATEAGTLRATDVEGDALAYAIARPPRHGTVQLDAASGAFTYRPAKDYNGADDFEFTAFDGRDMSAPATVSLTVLPVNDPPVAQAQGFQVDEEGVVQGALSATDVDGDPLTWLVAAGPAHGTLAVDGASGAFTYRPVPDYHGSDSFAFVASDGRLASAPAEVAIAVLPVNDPPVAQDQALRLDEDTAAAGTLQATDVDGDALTYAIVRPPRHGTVQLDAASGAFTYRPAQDYNGADDFQFTASDGQATSAPATFALTIDPVNDPPVLPPLPDITNSAETRDSFIALPVRDVDGDRLTYQVAPSDEAIATVLVDTTGTLVVTPHARGATTVSLQASDGVLTAPGSFRFTVTDVLKERQLDFDAPAGRAIQLTNTSAEEVEIELIHDGHPLVATPAQLLDDVRALPDERPGEPFERKLWRYLRDNVYHWPSLSYDPWVRDSVLLTNSIGFGFCYDVMVSYVVLARLAGYQARGWGLTGHAVPEVFSGGRWQIYDPDLAVYYERDDGLVAGMEDLRADPSLVTAPRARLFPQELTNWPYTPDMAAMYGQADNWIIGDWAFGAPDVFPGLRLPPRVRITYPGEWAPVAASVTFDREYPVPASGQLKMDLPPGFAGAVAWPLALWEVRGTGTVEYAGMTYATGSPELTRALQVTPGPGSPLRVLDAPEGLSLVYLVNPLRFGAGPSSRVGVRSLEAWKVDIAAASLHPDVIPAWEFPLVAQPKPVGVGKPR